MADYLTALITAAAGLFGVALGGIIALLNQRRERADERIQQQLNEFYSPFLGIHKLILAKSEFRLKHSGTLDAAWQQPLTEARARGEVDLKKVADKNEPDFDKAMEHNNRVLRDEIVPLYNKLVDLFTNKMWLTEASTRQHLGALVEFVEIWNRQLAGAIPKIAIPFLGHSEDKVKPLYKDVADHVESLTKKLILRPPTVKRGLNRLFMVFALIWILCGFSYSYTSEKAAQSFACASIGGGGIARIPSLPNSSAQAPPEGVRVQGPDGQMYLFPAGTTKTDAVNYFKQQRDAQRSCESSKPVRAALLIALVPAIVGYGLCGLFLLAGTWVWQGFRKG